MGQTLKTVAIVQARMASTRLPGKVMLPICGQPMLGLLLQRLAKAKRLDQIVVATSTTPENQPIVDLARKQGYSVFQGSETDVLGRYLGAALDAKADVVVRITADCPLIDPDIVDAVVEAFFDHEAIYASNVAPPTFPDGLDTEVFSIDALQIADVRANSPAEREHVTPFIRNSSDFSRFNFSNPTDFSSERWTVDEPEDFEVVTSVFNHFYPQFDFGWLDVLSLSKQQPHLFHRNRHIRRNEGAQMSSGQKLWRRAQQVIPGGTMLLSKRPEMFLPGKWPVYFSKAHGCYVWDMDGNRYTDMSLMGVGTNVLGYADPQVDQAVRRAIDQGNMSTLNCPEEVYLAERLVQIHPWAEMVRFARSGGEANAIAIRLARAASSRDKVAICGYHGWHDWYLAANLPGYQLDEHLLPGLDPIGVPENLRGTVVTFRYNRFDELKVLVDTHPDIGVIKMEVARNEEPQEGFLQKVRDLATTKNIVLVFDECSSGFRQHFGGLHKVYGVDPDLAVFGKTLGNGYAITAVVGRRAIMDHAQTSFISSTFWTERIGSIAGLATLEVMEQVKSWDLIQHTGKELKVRWQMLADKYDLEIAQWGLPGLQGFTFQGPESDILKTLVTQEMLKKGYLANNTVYVSTAHTTEIIEEYLLALDSTFQLVKECQKGKDASSLLEGPVCHSGFKRLN
ncbi:MAG: aminotransferase class III-fold pyridoxal phosphate-dependent enzyme [Proteobacteria bacterium]|nr:aminotransferase class III-fold pyridoxal phosphate-dependent enzyme [Pseudomonadota bacterium]